VREETSQPVLWFAMPCPSFLLANIGSGHSGNHERSYGREGKNITDPALNAPMGFRTGAAAAASCSRRLEVWNDLVNVERGETRERDEMVERRGSRLDAMPEIFGECTCQSRFVWEKD
jgi:hypothetical protein